MCKAKNALFNLIKWKTILYSKQQDKKMEKLMIGHLLKLFLNVHLLKQNILNNLKGYLLMKVN